MCGVAQLLAVALFDLFQAHGPHRVQLLGQAGHEVHIHRVAANDPVVAVHRLGGVCHVITTYANGAAGRGQRAVGGGCGRRVVEDVLRHLHKRGKELALGGA
ncbi:hypothetical protein D3C72_2014110 [compost metagenome]